MSYKLYTLPVLFLGLSGCSDANFVVLTSNGVTQNSPPPAYKKEVAYAYDDFQQSGQDSACFTVAYSKRADQFWVVFGRNLKYVKSGDEVRIGPSDSEKCKIGVTYVFNSNTGELERKFYQR